MSSSAALLRFASRFPLSSDWLSFPPRTSSRPSPAALFCFSSRSCVPIHFLMFHAVLPGLLPPALFSSALRFLLFSGSHSFVLISHRPLLSTSSKQHHAHEAVWLPFVLLMIFIVFSSPDLDLHTPCHCSSIEDGVLVKGSSVLLGRKEWLFLQCRHGKWIFIRAGVSSCNGAAGKCRNRKKRAVNTLAWRTATVFCKGIWQRFLQGRDL